MKRLHRKWLKVSILIITFSFGIYIAQPMLIEMMSKLQSIPKTDALLYISLIYIIGNLLILPIGLPINFLAGILWGTFSGGLLINVMATFVAMVSFLLARQFGTDFTDDLFDRFAMLRRFKNAVNRFDWQFIAMMRINPIIPFSLSNYVFGLIPGLSFRCYLVATMISNLLPCFIFAGMGATLKILTLENFTLHQIIMEAGGVFLLITTLVMLKIMKLNPQGSQ